MTDGRLQVAGGLAGRDPRANVTLGPAIRAVRLSAGDPPLGRIHTPTSQEAVRLPPRLAGRERHRDDQYRRRPAGRGGHL